MFLTADRPPESIDCGANQAIRQNGLYARHPTWHIDLPRIPASGLKFAGDSAMARLQHGALHNNCRFAEPLYGGDEQCYAEWSAALGDWWQGDQPWLWEQNVHVVHPQPDWFFWRQKRGVIVAGRMRAEEGVKLVEWAAMLGWPLIGDVLSQTGQPLPCVELLQFGGSLTGKHLLQWQENCCPEEYWLIDALPGRLDPAHHRGCRIRAEAAQWLALHPAQPHTPWAGQLARLADEALDAASTHLANRFGQAQLAHRLTGAAAGKRPAVSR